MDGIKRYLRFVRPYKWQIGATIIIGLIKFGIPLILPLLLKHIIDDIIQGSGSLDDKNDRARYDYGGGQFFYFFAVLRPPIEYYRQYFAQSISNRVLYDLRKAIFFDHLQRLSLRYYSNTRTGEVISRTINDVEQTKDFVVTGLMNVWLDTATVFIAIAVMFSMSGKINMYCTACVACLCCGSKIFLWSSASVDESTLSSASFDAGLFA
ncbi:hypothetical protein GCM10020331_089150 [Ectobacillus funiculus]